MREKAPYTLTADDQIKVYENGKISIPVKAIRHSADFKMPITVLALTQPAGTFVALQQPVGLPILGLGFASLFSYRHRLEARQAAATPRDSRSGDDQAEGMS